MLTAKDYLEAFNNSCSKNDKTYLDVVLAAECTIQLTGSGHAMSRQELLDSLETDWWHGCSDFIIIRDEADHIAGTFLVWGGGNYGPWKSKCFFYAAKAFGKITEWYVHDRYVEV